MITYAIVGLVLLASHATVFYLGSKHATSTAKVAAAVAQVVADAKKV